MSITVDTRRCVGCRICELACSLARCGRFDPDQAAIRVVFEDDGTLSVAITEACLACRRPLCAAFCPAGAIVSGEN